MKLRVLREARPRAQPPFIIFLLFPAALCPSLPPRPIPLAPSLYQGKVRQREGEDCRLQRSSWPLMDVGAGGGNDPGSSLPTTKDERRSASHRQGDFLSSTLGRFQMALALVFLLPRPAHPAWVLRVPARVNSPGVWSTLCWEQLVLSPQSQLGIQWDHYYMPSQGGLFCPSLSLLQSRSPKNRLHLCPMLGAKSSDMLCPGSWLPGPCWCLFLIMPQSLSACKLFLRDLSFAYSPLPQASLKPCPEGTLGCVLQRKVVKCPHMSQSGLHSQQFSTQNALSNTQSQPHVFGK